MNAKCTYPDCQSDWQDDKPDCLLGDPDFRKCPNFVGDATASGHNDTVLTEADELSIPWSGSAMGSLDVQRASAVKHPFIVGLVGPAKAGKTTLLAALYLLLRGGKQIGEYKFAGSYTLLGWEKVAHFLTLNSHKKVSFPPHTSANMARVPGLLHLLLKDKQDRYRDVLLTDAPGEWFSDWAKAADTEAGTGARWIDERADAFIIVADSKAYETNIGLARHTLLQIVERMKNTHQQRPTALVWTKADIKLSPELKTRVAASVKTLLPNTQVHNMAVINRTSDADVECVLNVINDLLVNWQQQDKQMLRKGEHQYNQLSVPKPKTEKDFFFLIRGDE